MRKPLIFFVMSCLISGCNSATVPIKVFAQSTHCSVGETLQQVSSEAEVLSAIGQNKLQLGSQSAKPRYITDTETANYLVVGAGSKPTSGYHFSLEAAEVEVKNATLALPLVLNTPPADAMLAQMLTQPCIVLELTKSTYNKVTFGELQLNIR